MSYNYSYNVLINRLEAFAAGHFLIKRFTHGQIDMADQMQDDEYPFMHVTPDTIEPVQGGMQFGFHIIFADIPRDKEVKTEYQREVISDCVRLGQDLIAEIRNGLQLFGFNVQLVNNPVFEPFMEEQKNTVTGVAFTIKLEVPWDWSACDIPAIWSTGGESTGGSGEGFGILLQTNSVNNQVQSILNLVNGTNITIVDNGDGSVTINSTGGGGGGGSVTSVGLSVPAPANAALSVSGSPVTTSGTLAITANGNSSQYIDGSGALQTFPLIPSDQGLQSVITYDNDLTTNNSIVGNSTVLSWNDNSAFEIKPESTGYFRALVGKYPPSESELYVAALYAQMRSKGATEQIVKVDTIGVYIQTPAVDNSTATNGQVLALTDAATGKVEFVSAASGTVTSVGLSMPAAFTVTNSPVTTSGTLTVTGAGLSTQYIDGTGALQTFPALSGYVPYTGATQDVDLDTNKLSASSVYIEGTAGNGHLHLKHQSADATATGQSTSLWADTNGDIKWKNDGNYKTTLKTSLNNADRTYTFPNENCELMPRNAAITAATKTKITYDADGLVTAGADIVATDVSDSTTVGQNLIKLANPSAIRYIRINADNSISALSLADLKTDLGLGTVILAADWSNAGTAGYEDVTGFSFAVTSGKTYKWRSTIAITQTATGAVAINGPTVTFNRYRFTYPSGASSNAVGNYTTYNQPTVNTTLANGVVTSDGIFKASANGTLIIRGRSSSIGGLTILAGSIIEWEEVL